ncbi:MAG TPA: DUF2145 domain-containing protein [Rhizobacter sp.]|nr:DUF2145 domain-containing protein [Rhizobacter sp.]
MNRGGWRWRRAALLLLLSLWPWSLCQAESLRYCDRPTELSADQQDELLRFGGFVRAELEASGQRVALLSRSGLDLGRFGQRYSHSGVSLLAQRDTPWAVRQLYFACDERRPRLYDEGLAGFVLGTHDPVIGYVSVVLLPAPESERLERSALDNRQALELLASSYSANAYPFSTRYQNCNQWVMEMLATAWALLPLDGADSLRTRAQQWLQAQGYAATVFDVGSRVLMWFGAFVPWLHRDDHPREDLAQALYRVSMPASIEAFVHQTVPDAQRIELCHAAHRVVIHRGWEPIADGCVPGAQDTLVQLD